MLVFCFNCNVNYALLHWYLSLKPSLLYCLFLIPSSGAAKTDAGSVDLHNIVRT